MPAVHCEQQAAVRTDPAIGIQGGTDPAAIRIRDHRRTAEIAPVQKIEGATFHRNPAFSSKGEVLLCLEKAGYVIPADEAHIPAALPVRLQDTPSPMVTL